MFSKNKIGKIVANKVDIKQVTETVVSSGVDVVKEGISSIFYAFIIKAVVTVVVVIGAITATIYAVGSLFN